jgi:diaminopimelate epimerase
MKLSFSKYQGTGNDFVMLDNSDGKFNDLSISAIQFLCNRKTGIGADGLIKISSHDTMDFEVEYFNADGSQSFCGNGARCSVAYAKTLGLLKNETTFLAIDGKHKASIDSNGIVKLEMLPVKEVASAGDQDHFADTGSPHYMRVVTEANKPEIVKFGREIRYSDEYKEQGVNVNTVLIADTGVIEVETYERGVEDETLSCGTGVTACALLYMEQAAYSGEVQVKTKGGVLSVQAELTKNGFENIWLSGPAKKVFDGSLEL